MSESPYTLDPITNFCMISAHSTLLIENKLYVTPGYWFALEDDREKEDDRRLDASPWFRVIDMNEPFSLSDTSSVTTILPLDIAPIDVPVVEAAAFWYDDVSSAVIYSQGSPAPENGVFRDRNLKNYGRKGKSWTAKYFSANQSLGFWQEFDTPFENQAGLVGTLRDFYDPVGRKGYMYGGFITGDGDDASRRRNQVVTYDTASQLWTNTTARDGSFDAPGVAVPYRTAGGKLLSLLFGGNLNDNPLSMGTVFIHDIEENKWYRQDTDGEAPSERSEFCAVSISAPDNSSTQVLVYGGQDPKEDAGIWVLNLPSFTWTRLEQSTPDLLPGPGLRLQPACHIVNNRFFTIFGGRNLVDGDAHHCDQNQNALFMFDLNEREWIESYDPQDKEEYRVPREVYEVIGGNEMGFATKTKPAEGFAEKPLSELFATSTSTILNLPTDTPSPFPSPPASASKPVGAIAGGVAGGIALIIALLLVVFWFLRRRKQMPSPEPPSYSKGPGLEESPPSPIEADSRALNRLPEARDASAYKSANMPVELPGENYHLSPRP